MKFLVVLITIFLYRNWIGENPLRDGIPFGAWMRWFRRNIAATGLRFILCIGIPTLVIWWVALETYDWWVGLWWMLLSVLVMAYSIDVVDLDLMFDDQANWLQRQDDAHSLLDAKQGQADFRLLAVYQVFQSLYPAFLWFLLLGPAGALLYTLTRLYLDRLEEGDPELRLVERVLYVLEWPAARITGFIFALVGNFGRSVDAWLDGLFSVREPIGENLEAVAGAACSAEERDETMAEFVRTSQSTNHELKDLLQRTSYGWLGVAALATILG